MVMTGGWCDIFSLKSCKVLLSTIEVGVELRSARGFLSSAQNGDGWVWGSYLESSRVFTLWFHQTWLKNPRNQWWILARKITDFYGPWLPASHVWWHRRVPWFLSWCLPWNISNFTPTFELWRPEDTWNCKIWKPEIHNMTIKSEFQDLQLEVRKHHILGHMLLTYLQLKIPKFRFE